MMKIGLLSDTHGWLDPKLVEFFKDCDEVWHCGDIGDISVAEKLAIEDARFVLPNACETKMVVTMNARSLQNFFHLRCCSRAQWEIRQLAEEMFRLVYPVAPHIFAKAGPACLCGPCPEGKMCCGKTAEVRAKYAAIKEGAAV